ncbi:response regulator, partial [Synergistaceae bacterium OttesenSCG-928-I11]|nr:response regulator [Synergistaceae bacterium OttesenSCG-928-I11]
YDYFFVSTFVFESARNAVTRLGLGGEMVVFAEIGEVVADLNVRTVVMPAHALSIASILNDECELRPIAEDYEPGPRFIAPDARVLVVDDIATNLSVAQGLIAPYGIQVDICRSGEEAVELVRRNHYDIVFMDHMMPEMDGIEATELIRSTEGACYKNLPIVALTANAMSGMREMFIDRGLNDFLPKPIDTKRLGAVIERWIPPEKLVRGQSADTVQTLPEKTLDIAGLDASSGIAMTGGSFEQYLAVLSVFHGEGYGKIKEIRFAAAEGDFRRYTTHVHAVKSAAATIGAAHLSDFARALEAAGKKRDTALIASATENFLEEYAELLRRIGELLDDGAASRDAAAEVGEMSVLRENLSRLREALERYDAGAADGILRAIRAYRWELEVARAIEAISQNILLFEYESAVSVIDNLLEQ